MIKGTDMAYGDKQVDYAAMKADAVRFGYCKLVQYGYDIDPCFPQHRTGFTSQGLPWGPYLFNDFRQSGARNAQHFYDAINKVGDIGTLPPWMDIEYEDRLGWPHPDWRHMLAYTHDAFDELDRLMPGLDPMLYTNQEMIWYWPEGDSITEHRLALAATTMAPHLGPWKKATIQQYALDVRVPWSYPGWWGVGSVDLDLFLGTEQEFVDFCHGVVTPPAPPPPPVEAVMIPMVVQASSLYVRSGPGTNYGVISGVVHDQVLVDLLDIVVNGPSEVWLKFKDFSLGNGKYSDGWVAMIYGENAWLKRL